MLFYINQVQSEDIAEFRQRQTVLLTVQVSNSDSDFTDTVEVFVSPKSGYLFLATDRPIYKYCDGFLSTYFSRIDL